MTPIVPSSAKPDLLDRHQFRREQSIPTVSVLCGPVGLGVGRWRAWAARRSVGVVALKTSRTEEAVLPWARALAASRDLVGDAVAWLAGITGRNLVALGRDTIQQTGRDFEWFWDNLTVPSDKTATCRVCRFLLAPENGPAPSPPSAKGLLEALATGRLAADVPTIVSLAALAPPRALPTLLLVAPQENAASWLIGAAPAHGIGDSVSVAANRRRR